MRKTIMGTAAGCCLLAGNAFAFDESKIILCATTQVQECIADNQGCNSVKPEDVNAPTFMRINLKKNEIVIRPSQPATEIEHREQVENRLILMGAEDGSEDQPDGVGWAISINQESGRFVTAVAGAEASLTLFGACTEI